MDMGKVIKWLEYDYFPRVGAYRKDCKQGCDACMPMHEGDDYCDIDMLCKVLAMLKEQEDEKQRIMKVIWDTLHEGLSIDTIPDQDWVSEQIRHRIEDT